MTPVDTAARRADALTSREAARLAAVSAESNRARALRALPSSPDVMRAEIESAQTVEQLIDLMAKADSLASYAKVAFHSDEKAREFKEMSLRAKCIVGRMLADDPEVGHGKPDKLSGFGIQHHQSSRWQRIASLPEAEFEAYIADAFRNERDLTEAGLLKLAKQLAAADKPDAGAVVNLRDHEHDGDATPDVFPTIVIDPPWRYDNVATRGAAEDHYPTMTLDELAALDIPADVNAHMYLWVTNSFLRQGFDLLDAWGFTYKTCLTWCKPQIGMGNWFRNTTEHVLFAVRGQLATARNDVPTHFVADRTRHSAKPESFYDLVESCSPGPWLEMFARRRRMGWAHWGNEA